MMNTQLGEQVKKLREKQYLYLRQVAPLLKMDIDQQHRMKYEYGNLNETVVKDANLTNKAMQVTEKNINQKY
jgi:hypothetical protein